jgi:hypothetical protein
MAIPLKKNRLGYVVPVSIRKDMALGFALASSYRGSSFPSNPRFASRSKKLV